MEELWNSAKHKHDKWRKPNQMLIKSSLTKPIDKVAPASESKNPHGHATPNRSHAIVTTQTSDPVHRGNAEIAVDVHLTGINVQPEEKPAMHVEKLVILLMFADQNPELWLL